MTVNTGKGRRKAAVRLPRGTAKDAQLIVRDIILQDGAQRDCQGPK